MSERLTGYLELLQARPAADQSRAGWLVAHCPLGPWRHGGEDRNPSFGIRHEPGDARTHCFSCGWSGRMSTLVFEHRRLNSIDRLVDGCRYGEALTLCDSDKEVEHAEAPDVGEVLEARLDDEHEWPDWWLESFPDVREYGWAVNYLVDRGVTDEQVVRFDLRADPVERRVCFPVRDVSGRVRGMQGRSVDGAEPRYRVYKYRDMSCADVWLGEHVMNSDAPLVVVEGAFDYASVDRVYPNVVAMLSSYATREKYRRLRHCSSVITMLDRGDAGDAGRARVERVLGRYGVDVVHAYVPDHRKDPGEMTKDEVESLVRNMLEASYAL